MTFARFPAGGWPGDSAGWDAQNSWLEAMRQSQAPRPNPTQPQAPAAGQQPAAGWRPSFLNTPRVEYPASPYANTAPSRYDLRRARAAGGGGGGGGVGFNMPFMAVEPSASLGGGGYWPGHSADFARQQQQALLGIAAGRLMPDSSQPAQMAAGYAALANNPNPNARRLAASMGFGGGGGRGGAGGLAGDFQRAFDEARQENEARYRDILEGYDSRHNRALGYLEGAGAQEYADTNERYDAQRASGTQHLMGRGLGNSTLVNTMNMGVERERSNDIGRLEERLRDQFLTYDTGLSGDTLGFMERRSDTYPDYAQLAQLAQLEGQAGNGAGGGGVGLGGLGGSRSVSMAPNGGFMPVMGGGVRAGSPGSYLAAQANVGKQNVADRVAFIKRAQAAGYSEHEARLLWSRGALPA